MTAMHRPRARVGRAAAFLSCVVVLTGCGSAATDSAEAEDVTPEVRACRAEWKELGQQVRGRDRATNPSVLATRWNTIAATIDYYAVQATEEDCGSQLDAQEDSMTALAEFVDEVAPYDMPRRLQEVYADASDYANGPRPTPSPLPKGSTKKERQRAEKAQPPAPSTIAADLTTLRRQAPVATDEQGPAWQQARVVDLEDDAARAKAVKDLAFLSRESAAYGECAAALRRIRAALAAAQG